MSDRRTVAAAVRWTGVGVHTGERCAAEARPGDSGIRFVLGGEPVRIHPGLARETLRCTGLEHAGASVLTVEHLLAALNGMGVTDADVEVTGPEVPILDGSAAPFAEALLEASFSPLPPRESPPFQPVETDAITISPGRGRIEVTIDFPHPAIRRQALNLDLTPDLFLKGIAPARTFGFFEEAERLRAMGRARGASLENTVVFSEQGPMTPLRFSDEPVRHKALDLIGDLALSGRSIYHLTVRAERPGHEANTEAARRLYEGG